MAGSALTTLPLLPLIVSCYCADVAIWYNGNKKAIERAAEIEKSYDVKCTLLMPSVDNHNWLIYPTGKAYKVDVSDEDVVEMAVVDAIKDLNGRLDVFVARSGIPWTQGPAIDGEC